MPESDTTTESVPVSREEFDQLQEVVAIVVTAPGGVLDLLGEGTGRTQATIDGFVTTMANRIRAEHAAAGALTA
jgi:hypothetical protein